MARSVCLSVPCSPCAPFSFKCGWQPIANVTSPCPADAQHRGMWAGRWGAQGASSRSMAWRDTGVKRTLRCTPAWQLFSGHGMRCSSLSPSHTMCQTHPAEPPVKCKNLWCFWATTALYLHYLHKVCLWYTLSLPKGVSNEFENKPPSGLVFTQKLFPLTQPWPVNVTLKVAAVISQFYGEPAVPSDQCSDISEMVSDPEAIEFHRKTSD